MTDERQPRLKRLRLKGARFEGGRLPVDSLVELQRYQDVVRIASEAEWLRDHPNEAVPSDLSDSVRLTIDRIDSGSADVFLAFEQHLEYRQYQEEAQEAADANILAAYSGARPPGLGESEPGADWKFRQAIAQFGSSLGPEQAIEFYVNVPDGNPVSITTETRERALEEIFNLEDFMILDTGIPAEEESLRTEDEGLTGRITALDANKRKFDLETNDGQVVHGWYREHPELLEDFRAVVNSTSEGPLTRVSGKLQFKSGKPFRFWQTTSIERVEFDETAWGARLRNFAQLQHGWDDEGGLQISSIALDASQSLLRSLDNAGHERPGVFPTPEGGVLIEWTTASSVSSVEVLPDGSFEMFALREGEGQGRHAATSDVREALSFVAGRAS